MLHNSNEFHPFVIYLKPPPIEEDPEAIQIEQNGDHEMNGENGVDKGSSHGSSHGSQNALITVTTKHIVSTDKIIHIDRVWT